MDIPEDKDGHTHKAGDDWQLRGPLTYIPRPEVVRLSWCCVIMHFCSYHGQGVHGWLTVQQQTDVL